MSSHTLHVGDCREVMRTLQESSIDAIVTDPPYGLEFMGKEWDKLGAGVERTPKSAGGFGKESPTSENAFAAARVRYGKSATNMQEWHRLWAIEALRVLKPGGHALVFGGTRTHHRLMCGLEDAGFEIRDCLMWVYGSGFPKSLDVSKAIDKAAGQTGTRGDYISADHAIKRKPGNERMHEGYQRPWRDDPESEDRNARRYIPATDEAKQWEGYGTALKPAFEPIILCRKPLEKGLTVAQNVLKWGTGALSIDGCRIEAQGWTKKDGDSNGSADGIAGRYSNRQPGEVRESSKGRWPANLIHDGSAEVLALFPETKSGDLTGQPRVENKIFGSAATTLGTPRYYAGDSGSAARFFYTAKASGTDRGNRTDPALPLFGIDEEEFRNTHPTVKPLALMRYLCRLITPPNGVVLDCFTGSGSTGKAAIEEGFRFIGIELDPESAAIATRRLSK